MRHHRLSCLLFGALLGCASASGPADGGVWPDAATLDGGLAPDAGPPPDVGAADAGYADASDAAPLDLQARLTQILAEEGVPALGVVVVRSGGEAARAVAGVREAGASEPVAATDVWQLGSITKTFTAHLVDRLDQDGLLSWDDRLGDLLPGVQASPAMAAITLRELAEHRSGLQRDPPNDWIPTTVGLELPARRRALLEAAMANAMVGDKRYAYSNLGFHLLGAIVEARTGEPWEQALQARLGAPLGIDAIVYGEPRATDPSAPAPHVYEDGAYRAVSARTGDVVYDTLAPAGHVSLDLEGFGAYLQANLRAARGEASALRAAAVAGEGKTLTWFQETAPGGLGRQLLHTGSNGRNYAFAAVLEQADLAFGIVGNFAGGPRRARAFSRVSNAILAAYGEAAGADLGPGRIEGEAMRVVDWSATVTVQRFGGLSNGAQLWWRHARAGEVLGVEARAAPGRYRVFARLCHAADYGGVDLTMGERTRRLSFTQPRLEWKELDLGIVDAPDGLITLRFAAVEHAEGGVLAHLGLDTLRIEPAP